MYNNHFNLNNPKLPKSQRQVKNVKVKKIYIYLKQKGQSENVKIYSTVQVIKSQIHKTKLPTKVLAVIRIKV